MSCPDWKGLATAHGARGGAGDAREPEGWRDALEHLDGCDGCRSDALAADPLLVFRRLPAVEADAATVEDVRAGVAALRRAHRMTAGAEPPRPARVRRVLLRGRRASLRWWGRAAAAVVLAAGLLGLQPEVEEPRQTAAAPRVAAHSPFGPSAVAPAFAVDDIEHPTASVYHFDDGDLGVVMVVDAGLDV